MYGIELYTPNPIAFVDALVMASAAVSVTGLSAVSADVSRRKLNAVLMLLTQLGSAVMMSTVPLILKAFSSC